MAMYQLDEDQLNSVLNYLSTRPYQEVVTHISTLTTAQPVKSLEELQADRDAELEKE